MLGVLVVRDTIGRCGYLAGHAGEVNGDLLAAGFVPPILDPALDRQLATSGDAQLTALSRAIDEATANPVRGRLEDRLLTLRARHQESRERLHQCHLERKRQRDRIRATLGEHPQPDDARLRELAAESRRDKRVRLRHRDRWQRRIHHLQNQLETRYHQPLRRLHAERESLAWQLREHRLDGYRLRNARGEVLNIRALFAASPPQDAGDCAAPKLLQYAYLHDLQPLALAEFWWGPPDEDGLRRSGHFYSPCRGRCRPILDFQLQGLNLDSLDDRPGEELPDLKVVYIDSDLILVDKPAGLLSVPGRTAAINLQHWLQNEYGPAVTPAHRLDMATSGLLLAARHPQVHRRLQQQFAQQRVRKQYVALLSRAVRPAVDDIDLPLRIDLDDRPRQVVCREHGKQARTRVKLLAVEGKTSRVELNPLTGRTHQLRVHAAHPRGLDAPIVGDELYGERGKRLLLHAAALEFVHPVTNRRLRFESATPF